MNESRMGPGDDRPLDGGTDPRTIQELQVAQAELEMQNEELRTARESLELSHRRYESLFHNAPVGYLVLDRVGLIQQVNESFCRLIGHAPDHLLRRPLRGCVVADQQDAFDRLFASLLRDTPRRGFDLRLQHAGEGRELDVRVEVSLIAGMPGGAQGDGGILMAISDITEARSLERQLHESQKLETVGRLAGGIAHDFNNALTVIQSTIDVARMDLDEGDTQLEYLQQIETAASRSSALVQQLLAFANKGLAVPRVLDPGEVLAPMRTMLGRLLPESVALRWDVDDNLSRIHMDPVQVDQVLTNLVLNARDAIGESGAIVVRGCNVRLDADARRPNPRAAAGNYVRLSVGDDGCGMDAATRERAFEPFFTTKGQGKGSGLGLSTVYGIVAQNRGLISLDTEPGAGTTVTIDLPATSDSKPGAGEVSFRGGLSGSERILLVEDDDQILFLAKRLLSRKGYQVVGFDHPDRALAWFTENPDAVDVVLSDVVMPDRSGPSLVDALLEIRPGLPFAFMSGYLKDEVASRRLLDEKTVFIPKPFDSVTLLTALRQVLDGARSE
jgi:two-component system cell cycle sensor histidine kinase/response regulator CckA